MYTHVVLNKVCIPLNNKVCIPLNDLNDCFVEWACRLPRESF
jgi:hypothetical protein